MRTPRTFALALATFAAHSVVAPPHARADERTLDDYRYFRALSIDLSGRIPSREELATFESSGFDVDAWIDAHLAGDAYVDRVRRIYMDALKLEVSNNFNFFPALVVLRRYPIVVVETNGTTTTEWVYWRANQLREDTTLNRAFCFSTADTGQTYPRNQTPTPEVQPKPVPRAVFDARTTRIKPWWLYRDYRASAPKQHYSSWGAAAGRFTLELPNDPTGAAKTAADARLLRDPSGAVATDVAVCNEEAQTADKATATVRGQSADVACNTDAGLQYAKGCGCGPGLERCMPGAGVSNDPRAVVLPTLTPWGPAEPFEVGRTPQSDWWRTAWTEEARAFLGAIVGDDRDFREVLTAKDGVMNGPLAQFYRAAAFGDTAEQVNLGMGTTYLAPDAIVEPSALPSDLLPFEMDRWVKVPNRGAHAAGILTTAAFLAKYASRRGRAHAVYTTFQCRDFVAENLKLEPSNEPNLMIRPGCSTCHAALEPLAAYFTRTRESSFAWIAAPIDNPVCTFGASGGSSLCNHYYDPDFSTPTAGKLRGAYAAPDHVEQGPAGLAQAVAQSPEFSSCVTQRLTESLLGRSTSSPDDDTVLGAFQRTYEQGGFRLRALVRAIVKSEAYRHANSTRTGGGR